MQDSETALFYAVPISKISEVRIRKGLTIYKLIVRDESGTAIISWFNQPYLKTKFIVGESYSFFGKISRKNGKVEINSPIFETEQSKKNTGKIVPLYPLTYNLSQNVIRKIIECGMESIKDNLEETLPTYILETYNLEKISYAIKNIHFPENFEAFNKARNRLVFEELLTMQLALLNLKDKYNEEKEGITFNKNIKMSDAINKLPFKLTNAQIKVLEEIDKDMERIKPMNRLLQGDVGSGKTVVATCALYKAVKSGYQGTIMVPTTILAKQHLESIENILNQFDISSEIIISSTTKKKKEEILERLKNGDIDVIIGTHALLQENVVFKNLGLVITDEQHRFGVRQRGVLASKGNNPDVLVMTATPIPRTLALILYGDLDISIIDELPPNRKNIDTFVVTKEKEERLNNFVKKQIEEGRQCYVVCPLVEESEEINAKSVAEIYEKYKNEIFKEYRVAYLHGKMKPKEKEEIMEEFKTGNIDILVSTTVIEVGVNVPNASLMIIENAERFGLSQLHQLRGRVGRGEYKSYTILKCNGKSKLTKERMEVMEKTNDGFIISEKDLELRGTGEFFGTKQHGIPEFKIANLFKDVEMLKSVQSVAIKIIENDPRLEKEENKKLKQIIENKFSERVEL